MVVFGIDSTKLNAILADFALTRLEHNLMFVETTIRGTETQKMKDLILSSLCLCASVVR